MTYHNAAKRVLTAPIGSDPRSADRLSLLCQHFNFPLKRSTVIKIFGQDGKSCCANLLACALGSVGYRVGVLATPFAHNITECITINGQPVSMQQFTESVEQTLAAATALREAMGALAARADEEAGESLSIFERSLLAYADSENEFSLFSDELLLISALRIFYEQACQIIILEIPSGDRAGAYRLPTAPTVSVITSTEDINVAARICRALDRNTPETVTALQDKRIYNMIAEACVGINCRLSTPLRSAYYPVERAISHMKFFYKSAQHQLNSGAYYQELNLMTVSETLEALSRHGILTERDYLNLSVDTTSAPTRTYFSFLSIHPNIVVDCADTPERVTAFAQSLRHHASLTGENLTLLVESNTLPDSTLEEIFQKQSFSIQKIIKANALTARRDLKPLIKALTPDDTWIILGSRAFTYEASRALESLLAM